MIDYDLVTIEPPVELPLNLAQVKAHVYEDGDENNDYLTSLLAAATRWFESAIDTRLVTQTVQITADCFPLDKWWTLPVWPVQSITSIEYTDINGDVQAIPAETIALRKSESARARFAQKNWQPWPAIADTPDAVKVTCVVGFGTRSDIPPMFTRPVLLLLAHFYHHRGDEQAPVPSLLESLISSMRPADQ